MEKKQCSECKEGKTLDCFGKRKKTKDGLNHRCKKCIKEYQDKGYQDHKPKILKEREKYREDHKEEILKYNKKHNNSPMKFNSKAKFRKEIELYEKEIKESDEGYLQCKCAYCGDGFTPTYNNIRIRLIAINYKNHGEGRLYCSEVCKKACPTYGQYLYSRDFKPATSREVQPELRQMVLARDDYTCKRCGKTKDELIEQGIALHCHHLEGIHGEPLMSADMDMCITYCQPCHVKAHQTPGCSPYDMQCTDIGKE